MSLFDFLKSKNSDASHQKPSASPVGPPVPALEDYPVATELAKRHADEWNWLLTGQSPPPQAATSESPGAQIARHAEDVKAAASSVPESKRAHFQIAYSRARIEHTKAHMEHTKADTRAIEARIVRTDPEYHNRKNQAQAMFNALQRGDDVGSSFAAAIQKGVESGRLVSITVEADRRGVIRQQQAEETAWLTSIVDDERKICSVETRVRVHFCPKVDSDPVFRLKRTLSSRPLVVVVSHTARHRPSTLSMGETWVRVHFSPKVDSDPGFAVKALRRRMSRSPARKCTVAPVFGGLSELARAPPGSCAKPPALRRTRAGMHG